MRVPLITFSTVSELFGCPPSVQLFLQHVDKFLSMQGMYQVLLSCHIRNLLHDTTLAGWTSPVRNVDVLQFQCSSSPSLASTS
ncbi:hypothetical protein EI94DRAFT_1806946 [Lactarius quietus]|nr:hypothetical protein EI94DRAFT_1806946 [Lactarius quietus]